MLSDKRIGSGALIAKLRKFCLFLLSRVSNFRLVFAESSAAHSNF